MLLRNHAGCGRTPHNQFRTGFFRRRIDRPSRLQNVACFLHRLAGYGWHPIFVVEDREEFETDIFGGVRHEPYDPLDALRVTQFHKSGDLVGGRVFHVFHFAQIGEDDDRAMQLIEFFGDSVEAAIHFSGSDLTAELHRKYPPVWIGVNVDHNQTVAPERD